ncbi:unnamed protein product [Rotaria sordida]|uniref:Uncharacterized protein n=2 Tax=Rotaria sordida TaxID=392033 RepID=A0A815B5W6_9BILA|nr:unnamed protein product [Rotaria sordida]CAF4086531.1 unnamed protein product [Rotaria sordida]
MSLSMFNNFCQNILKLIGRRLISLRITLNNVIGGWSLISSSLQSHQITLLRHLHLVDIEPYEFDKLLCNRLIKQLYTLIVDVTDGSSFHDEGIEGAYLTKVCSCVNTLRICRLPFNYYPRTHKQLLPPLMILPNLSNTNNLRILTIGMNSSRFLQRLLFCIPFIETLSIGIHDQKINKNKKFDIITLPSSIDANLLRRLSRLNLNCANNISFHQSIALLSSIFGQLTHLSLKLKTSMSLSDPFIISGDAIQQLCIDRLKPMSSYTLDLYFFANEELKEKILLKSFVQAPFTRRKRPKVIIFKNPEEDIYYNTYKFNVYTLPYNGTELTTLFTPEDLQISSQMLDNVINLYPHINKLALNNSENKTCLLDLDNCRNSLSLFVPWLLITKISINADFVGVTELEAILQLADNVHTLEIVDEDGILSPAILYNKNDLGTMVNRKIRSFGLNNCTLTLFNAEDICKLLVDQLTNLKKFWLTINDSYDHVDWNPYSIIDGENESTKRILNLIHLFIDHLQELFSLKIYFCQWTSNHTPCFPYRIRRELHHWLINRSYRLQCSCEMIRIWL